MGILDFNQREQRRCTQLVKGFTAPRRKRGFTRLEAVADVAQKALQFEIVFLEIAVVVLVLQIHVGELVADTQAPALGGAILKKAAGIEEATVPVLIAGA